MTEPAPGRTLTTENCPECTGWRGAHGVSCITGLIAAKKAELDSALSGPGIFTADYETWYALQADALDAR